MLMPVRISIATIKIPIPVRTFIPIFIMLLLYFSFHIFSYLPYRVILSSLPADQVCLQQSSPSPGKKGYFSFSRLSDFTICLHMHGEILKGGPCCILKFISKLLLDLVIACYPGIADKIEARAGELGHESNTQTPHEIVHGPQKPYGYFQRPSAQDAEHLIKGHGAVGCEVIHPSLLVLQQEVHNLHQVIFVDVLERGGRKRKNADLLAQVPGQGIVESGTCHEAGAYDCHENIRVRLFKLPGPYL